MSSGYLYERHNFKEGGKVVVFERDNPDAKYNGEIYRIVFKPENSHIKNSPCVDHFYIKFSKKINNILLSRGWNVICNHRPAVLGNVLRDGGVIQKIFTQETYPMYSRETEISLEDINAILVWRIAFEIQHENLQSKL